MKHYVTRNRRAGEEIDYADGFDEYIGRDHTGRIVKFVNGEAVDYCIVNTTQDKDMNNIQKDLSVETQENNKEHTHFKVTVNHMCGQNEFLSKSQIDIEEYIMQLNNFYWDGFVIDITVEGI